MQIVQVKISELKGSEYNPRKWDEKAIDDLRSSIKKFGMVDPIIANSARERKNVVIGGHFRLFIAKAEGFETVPVVYVDLPNLEDEQELNIRLNKNGGEFDWNLLANIDEGILLTAGYTSQELKMGFGLVDFGNKNKEVDVDAIDETRTITFKFPNSKYLEIVDALQKAREDFGLETNEDTLDKLLEQYV